MARFSAALAGHGGRLTRGRPEVLQVNTGKKCNLTCTHCHVNAGPGRKEVMARETIDRVLEWLERSGVPTVDLTGGAPEIIPDFRHLVERAAAGGRRVIDRSNLTILLEPGFDDLPEFLARHRVEIVASLPCYLGENVDAQRGDGVFEASIAALQRLNGLGYGRGLPLHLVYNPQGGRLPPAQEELEEDYKKELGARFGIVFDRLYTITNMPIARFAAQLRHEGRLDAYFDLLESAFNPATLPGLMCRTTVSVDWEGRVYDCDFNQQLGIAAPAAGRRFLWEIDPGAFEGAQIAVADHCFGCTAGAGSSCGGALESEPALAG
jgi:radical SAM/Cys-rich protein